MTGTTGFLVTGACGNLGSVVAAGLQTAGLDIRAGDLDPDRVAARVPGARPVRLDLTNPATFAPALEGVTRVFLVRPPAIARVKGTINRFIDVAAAAEVEHVVFSSVAGAESNRVIPHHRIERHLMASGIGWTMLRPGFFAQNLTTAYARDIREDDRLHVPAGGGKVAFVDTRDVGELAALILQDPTGHHGKGYTLTGPETHTFDQVATLLADELGRQIRYAPAGAVGYVRHLGGQQGTGRLPLPQRLVQTVLHVGLRRGGAAQVDPTLGRLLGRPPRTLATYIRDHRETWQREAAV